MTTSEKRALWEARYGAAPVWSGRVNEPLRAWSEAHPPSTGSRALDLACGEGGDALWLASQGWNVTGVDFAAAAIARALAVAANQGLEVEWIAADVTAWEPPSEFALVTLSFFHEALEVRRAAWTVAASALAEGGTLLITGHAPDPRDGAPGPPPESRFTPEEVAEHLGDGWHHVYRELRREATGSHAGHSVTDFSMELTRAAPPVT